jgi:hypothetical protein
MRKLIVTAAAACLALTLVPVVEAQQTQVLQGTQVRLVLLNGMSTSVAREGDPFVAVVAEPVYSGGQLLIPAGTRVHGQVGNILRPRRFAMFRGQAAMNLYFRSMEFDRREIPAQMSILQIYDGEASAKRRKDVKVEEGVMVESRHDVKDDVTKVAFGGGGGTVAGVIFGSVIRGLTIGLVGSTAYIVARRGKEVELPAQTGFLVRLDTTVTLPASTAYTSPYRTPQP